MKAVFGVVSLLIALAVVGLLTVRQLRAVGHAGAATPATVEGVVVPQPSGSGTVAQQARQLENQVANDVVKAMNQGAEAHRAESEKP